MKPKSHLLWWLLAGTLCVVIVSLILPPLPRAKKKATRFQGINNSARPTPEWLRLMAGTNLTAENKPSRTP